MESSRERVAARYESQRNQYLDLVVVDTLQHSVPDVAENQAEDRAANRFLEKQSKYEARSDVVGSAC